MEAWGSVLSFELRLRQREALRIDGQEPTPAGILRNGRRHPTAITAPVPEWLHREIGTNKSFENIRDIVKHIRAYLTRLQEQEDPKKQQHARPNHRGMTLSKEKKKATHNAAYRERNSLVRFPDIKILPTFHPNVLEDARPRSAKKKRAIKEGPKGDGKEENDCVEDDCSEGEEEYVSGTSSPRTAFVLKQVRLKVGSQVLSRGTVKKPNKKKKKKKKKKNNCLASAGLGVHRGSIRSELHLVG
ncbi:hypothetical protein PoHVEF18_005530 [Penicillium ochrochloron]